MKNLDHMLKFGRAPALISPSHAPELLSMAQSPERNHDNTMAALAHCAAGYGVEQDTMTRKPFLFAGGVAIIPVYGALLHRDAWCSSYATGYDYIGAAFAAAMGDNEVKGILFDVNSYGGHVAGNFELCREIYNARGKKPMMSLVDARALSGGYSIGSAPGRMIATDSGDIGSIGVVMMHMSMEQALKNYGVEVTFIHAGKHKVDGNQFQNLSDDVKKALQASVEKSYDKFVSLVVQHRGIGDDAVRNTEARVYDAEEAKSIGLIDDVMPPREAFSLFLSEVSNASTPTKEVKKMSHQNANLGDGEGGDNAPTVSAADAAAQASTAASTAASAAQKNEQTRIAAILNSDEGKKRPKQANHIAFNTSMSAEDAEKLMAVSGEEKPAEPEATNHDPLGAALAGTAQAGASGGGEGEEEVKTISAGERISATYKRITGR